MVRSSIVIDAPPSAVFDTLIDPNCYPEWVLGAKHLRAVDRAWPRRGARFHHRVGIGPISLADNTKLLDSQRDRRVVLEVRIRPLGTGRVQLDLKARRRGRATKVVMREHLISGPFRWLGRPFVMAAFRVRN